MQTSLQTGETISLRKYVFCASTGPLFTQRNPCLMENSHGIEAPAEHFSVAGLEACLERKVRILERSYVSCSD